MIRDNKVASILFDILGASLFGQAINNDKFVGLSVEEWQQLYQISTKQGVKALVFDIISTLPKEQQPPRDLYIRWIINVEAIEDRYKLQFSNAKLLSRLWADNDIITLVLKGFALSRYYPISMHRECGDFDCYLFNDYEKGNRIAIQNGAKINTEWYKHSEIYFGGSLIENHLYFVAIRGGKKLKLLNETLLGLLPNKLETIEDTNISLPPPLFTALFVTYHSFSHFISEGISMRHFCDWASFMNVEQNNFDWDEFYTLCRLFSFDRFVDVSNEIATKYLSLKIDNPNIVIKSQYTDKILDSVLMDDSNIYNSGKGKWHNRFKLIANVFKYRWKYSDIAQTTFFEYLWNTIWGFISKRDRHF